MRGEDNQVLLISSTSKSCIPTLHMRNTSLSPGQGAQLVGVLSCAPNGSRFDSWSGYISRLQIRSLIGEHTGGNCSMFLSHIDVYLCLSLSPLSKINKHIFE